MRVVFLLAVILTGLQAAMPAGAGTGAHQLSERTYEQLARIHTLMDRERYDEARVALERLSPRAERRPYEHALVLQTLAHLHAAQNRYAPAIDALEQCLALDALPPEASQQARYLLAQLQLVTADYPAAVASLERWFKQEAEPAPAAHALAGTAYAYTKHHTLAIEHLGKAIALAQDPDENWYRQLLAVYFEAGRYRSAADLLQQLIRRAPDNKDNWLQLAGVYHELGDELQSVAVMELAYLHGLLNGETELLNLARLYLYTDQPYQAGHLLEGGLHEGNISPGAENWRLLATVWVRAREPGRALAAVERGLEISPRQAELHLLRAQLLADREDWPAVIQATAAALAAGGLATPGKAHLLQGFAHYHLSAWQQARSAFGHARDFADTREQAGQWLEYLEAARRHASGPGDAPVQAGHIADDISS